MLVLHLFFIVLSFFFSALALCLLNLMPPSLSSSGDVSPFPLKSASAGLFLSPHSPFHFALFTSVYFFPLLRASGLDAVLLPSNWNRFL